MTSDNTSTRHRDRQWTPPRSGSPRPPNQNNTYSRANSPQQHRQPRSYQYSRQQTNYPNSYSNARYGTRPSQPIPTRHNWRPHIANGPRTQSPGFQRRPMPRTYQRNNNNQRSIGSQSLTPRYDGNNRRPSQTFPCYKCGLHEHNQGFCPAIGKSCNNCNIMGHFARVCRQNRPTNRPT